MPFEKGQGGRKAGSKNKLTEEVRELARSLFTKAYWTAKRKAIEDGTCPPQIEAKLLAYAYGEPKQEHTLNTGITVNIGFISGAEPPRTTVIGATRIQPQESLPEMIGTALPSPLIKE